jgi:hypothetical protein
MLLLLQQYVAANGILFNRPLKGLKYQTIFSKNYGMVANYNTIFGDNNIPYLYLLKEYKPLNV